MDTNQNKPKLTKSININEHQTKSMEINKNNKNNEINENQ